MRHNKLIYFIFLLQKKASFFERDEQKAFHSILSKEGLGFSKWVHVSFQTGFHTIYEHKFIWIGEENDND